MTSLVRSSRASAVALPPAALLLALLACGGARVPEPPRATEAPDPNDGICVDFPPPAAKAEELGPPPSPRAVWLDGQWKWRLGRWIWRDGGWTEPTPGARWSRPWVERQPNGALVWWPGRWRAVGVASARGSGPDAASGAKGPACPPPARPPPAWASASASAGVSTSVPAPTPPLVDAEIGDGAPAPPHTGPVRDFPADAPSGSPGRIVLDASIPLDADAQPALVQPPE